MNSSEDKFIPSFSSKSIPIISNSSLYSFFLLSSLAILALFIIPFSPINVWMLIPANIKITIIEITKATNVIAPSRFIFFVIVIPP